MTRGAEGVVREVPRPGDPAVLLVEEWKAAHPGLIAGFTRADGEGRGGGSDFGLATGGSAWDVTARWEGLGRRLGFAMVAVARQVHGSRLVEVASPPSSGVWVAGEADGLLAGAPGVLLGVTAADCVPVYVAAGDRPLVSMLHAGWRGVAAGILETGLAHLAQAGAPAGSLQVHLGPAICGDCYEVGPEVCAALGRPSARRVDLRAELAARARRAGVPAERVTRSAWCTRCARDLLHSHRGGGERAGRMAAFLGMRSG